MSQTAYQTAAAGGDADVIRRVGLTSLLGGNKRSGACDGACDGTCGGGCDGGCSAGNFTGGSYFGDNALGACGTMGCTGQCGMPGCGDYAVGTYAGGSCGCGQCGTAGYGTPKTCCCLTYGYYNGPLCDECYNPCNQFRNPCQGSVCRPYIYAGFEGLLMDREGDGSLDFDFEGGGRLTLGSIPDCAQGCEVVLTGLGRWSATDSVIIPVTATATEQLTGLFTSEFYSAELNRVMLIDDAARLLVGARYIDFEETFSGAFLDATGTVTPRQTQVENQLLGLQIGTDIYYPLARRLTTDIRGRAGAYINFGELSGTAALNQEEEDIAGFFEAGLGLRYLASRRMTMFARGEFWYLPGVATVEGEALETIRTGFLNDLDLDDDVIFYGVTGGVQIRF